MQDPTPTLTGSSALLAAFTNIETTGNLPDDPSATPPEPSPEELERARVEQARLDAEARRLEVEEAMRLVTTLDTPEDEPTIILLSELDNLLRVLGIEKVVARYLREAKSELFEVENRLANRPPIIRGSVEATSKAEAVERLQVRQLKGFQEGLQVQVHCLQWLSSGQAATDVPLSDYKKACDFCSSAYSVSIKEAGGLTVDMICHHLHHSTRGAEIPVKLHKRPRGARRRSIVAQTAGGLDPAELALGTRKSLMERIITHSQVPVLRQGFDIFDLNGNGTIDEFEFFLVLRGFGNDSDKSKLSELFNALDADGDRFITFKEFVEYMAEENSIDSTMVEHHLHSLQRLYRLVALAEELSAPPQPVEKPAGNAHLMVHSRPVGKGQGETYVDNEDDGEEEEEPAEDWSEVYRQNWNYRKLELAFEVFSIKALPNEEVDTMDMLLKNKEQLQVEDEDDEPEPFDPENLGVSEFVQLVLLEPSCTIIKFVEEVRQCQEIFSLFDEDGSDQISVSELGVALTKLFRKRPTQFEMQKLIETVDKDGSGVIDFCEFVHMLYAPSRNKTVLDVRLKILTPIEAIHEMFELFCIEPTTHFGPRQISPDQFGKLMRCFGEEWPQDEIRKLVDALDPTGTGDITFADFANVFTQNQNTEVYTTVLNQFEMLRKLFDVFDSDRSGLISVDELARVVTRIGKNPTKSEIDELISHVDYTGDGSIGFTEFVHMLAGDATAVQRYIKQQIVEFRQAFTLFDPDGEGTITSNEFRKVMNMFGEGAGKNTEDLLVKIDEDGNGEVDIVEFIGLMASDDSMIQSNLRSQLVSFRELFNLFDEEGTGQITADAFAGVLKTVGVECDHAKVVQMVIDSDQDGDGMLDFTEFVCMIADSTASVDMSVLSRLSEMRETFAMYDTDGSGSLDYEEIYSTLQALGQNVTRAQAKAMVDKVDESGDGELDFREFLEMMCATTRSDQDKPLAGVTMEDYYQQLEELLKVEIEDRRRAFGPKVFQVVLKVAAKGGFFQTLSEEAGGMLCQDMQLIKVPPGATVNKQGDFAFDFYVILGGEVQVFQRSESWTDWQRQFGSQDALWQTVNHLVQDMMKGLSKILASMPSEGSVKYTSKTTELVLDLSELLKGWFKWHKELSEAVTHDLHDIRSLPANMRQGLAMYQATRELTVVADEVRRENLLKQSNLQMQINCGAEAGDEHGHAQVYLENAMDMLQLMKELLSILHSTQAKLKKVFIGETPEDRIFVGKRRKSIAELKDDDLKGLDPVLGRYLGSLGVPHSFGDIGFIGGDEAKWPVSILAAPEDDGKELTEEQAKLAQGVKSDDVKGVVLARVSRRQWRMALIKEPLQFIESLPYFADLVAYQLEEVATLIKMKTIGRHEVLVHSGDPQEYIYLVKSGQLKVCVELEGPPSPRKSPRKSPRRKRRKSIALIGPMDMVFDGDQEGPLERYTADMVAETRFVVLYELPVSVLANYQSILRRYFGVVEQRENLRLGRIETTQSIIGPQEKDLINRRPNKAKQEAAATAESDPPKVIELPPLAPSPHRKAIDDRNYSKAGQYPLNRKDEIEEMETQLMRLTKAEMASSPLFMHKGGQAANFDVPLPEPMLQIADINTKDPFDRSASPSCTKFTTWKAFDPSRARSPFGYPEQNPWDGPSRIPPPIDPPASSGTRRSASVPLPTRHSSKHSSKVNHQPWLQKCPNFEMQERLRLPIKWHPVGPMCRANVPRPISRASTPTFLVPLVSWSGEGSLPPSSQQRTRRKATAWADVQFGLQENMSGKKGHRKEHKEKNQHGYISGWGCGPGQRVGRGLMMPPPVTSSSGRLGTGLTTRSQLSHMSLSSRTSSRATIPKIGTRVTRRPKPQAPLLARRV